MTASVQKIYERDPALLVWWATEIECVSAVGRLERLGELTARSAFQSLDRLDKIKEAWHEIEAIDAVRQTARRLLRVHALRAGDSLQLAAALVAAEGQPASLKVVSLDERLVDAARREGLSVPDLSKE